MKLSENFTLEEMTRSSIATRFGLDNAPSASDIENLRRLCLTVLEPLRAELGKPIRISSGLRKDAVNRAAGGANGSEHKDGRAADIEVDGLTPLEVCKAVERLRLPFNQLIHEFGAWCHVSVPVEILAPNREKLTAKKVGKKTVYVSGLIEV